MLLNHAQTSARIWIKFGICIAEFLEEHISIIIFQILYPKGVRRVLKIPSHISNPVI